MARLEAAERANRGERLLVAAVEVFRERGVSTATVAEIAAQAGVAKGSFYTYFQSKEHLLAVLKQRYADEMVQQAAAIASRIGADDIWSLADECVAAFVDWGLKYRELTALFVREGMTTGTRDLLAEADHRVQEILADGIRVGVAAGEFDVEDPWLAAGIVMYGVHGTLVHLIVHGHEIDRDALVRSAQQATRRALTSR